MEGMEGSTAARYRAFAERQARGVCPLYERLALAVAEDSGLIRFLDALPEPKRQPNLFLAAVRAVSGLPADGAALAAAVARDGARIAALMRARRTQTNEPGRCAVLLPALARLQGPLALIEVGASAGLCLLPDRYGYDYGRLRLGPGLPGAPVFPCDADARTPLPARLPEVVWRAGIDLAPLDPASAQDADWLRMLVWPGQPDRRARLDRALALAASNPPRVVRGDLLEGLAGLVAEAPPGATRVVFHTAVLAYLEPAARARFADAVRGLCVAWLSNEAPQVFPDHAAGLAPPPAGPAPFLLALDGAPLALTAPHGGAIRWIA